MQLLTAIICAALVATVLTHDHNDHDQMPLDYVKYPYQAVYPGDNEGIITLTMLWCKYSKASLKQ